MEEKKVKRKKVKRNKIERDESKKIKKNKIKKDKSLFCYWNETLDEKNISEETFFPADIIVLKKMCLEGMKHISILDLSEEQAAIAVDLINTLDFATKIKMKIKIP